MDIHISAILTCVQAVIYTSYGPPNVLKIKNIEKPTPKEDEVLIQVYYSTVNRTDCGFRSAHYFISRLVTGLLKPKYTISGSEFAGEVVEVGESVTKFKIGDRVFGFDDVRAGAHAEYVAKHENGPIAHIPDQIDFRTAAAAGEGATYALNDIQGAKVVHGQKVMVFGATGAIGSAAVQIMKYIGAEVTAVCSKSKFEHIASLGADRVHEYENGEYLHTQARFDFIFDAVGKSSYGEMKQLLKSTGIYCSTELGKVGQNPLLAIWFAITGSRRVIFPIPKVNHVVMEQIQNLLTRGVFKPLIDREYPIDRIVEAVQYVEKGHKAGNVLIKIGQ
jgi:NADPH:quinone reductase-like Zn-dependent oxidoreductase